MQRQCRQGLGPLLTGGAPVEVVVVLGHVGQDAQPVRHLQGHHVLSVQQGWDAQLLLGHMEGLGGVVSTGELGDTPSFFSVSPPAPPGRRPQTRLGPERSRFKFALCSSCVTSPSQGPYPDHAGLKEMGSQSLPWPAWPLLPAQARPSPDDPQVPISTLPLNC